MSSHILPILLVTDQYFLVCCIVCYCTLINDFNCLLNFVRITFSLSISASQHGFVLHRSCLSNLLETLEFITASLAYGLNSYEVHLNFAKAFELIPHQKLMHKLAGNGFQMRF